MSPAAASAAGVREAPAQPFAWTRLLPGLALMAGVGWLGKLTEQGLAAFAKARHLRLPNVEYVLWAILIGLVLANTVRLPRVFQAGIATCDFWLKVGIVLLGARFALGDVLQLGGISLALVVVEIAGKLAVLVKSTRNAMIGFVVLGFALYWHRRGQARAVGSKTAFLAARFPRFVLGFLALSALTSLHAFTRGQALVLGNLSRWAFLLTFAGVGLRTDLRGMFKNKFRPLVVGALGEVLIALLTLGLVVAANAVWRL